jgi:hypothetical protein
MKTKTEAALIILLLAGSATNVSADPWADEVVSYTPGTGVTNDFITGTPFTNTNTVLGEPTRYTSEPVNFGGPVQPFSGPFRNTEILAIGRGGQLTVSFDKPVRDHAGNPFGIDLLIFGNTAYLLNPFATNGVAGSPNSEGGKVEVSADGLTYFEIVGAIADGPFPTMGYRDVLDPLSSDPGLSPTDFTKPADPALVTTGLTLAQLVAAYDGSGGGVGIDISSTGLSWISYVRISNAAGAQFVPEIDGFADVRVPEPGAMVLLVSLFSAAACRGSKWDKSRR